MPDLLHWPSASNCPVARRPTVDRADNQRLACHFGQHFANPLEAYSSDPTRGQGAARPDRQEGDPLTEKETAVLIYLCRAGLGVIGRDTLLGEVWNYSAGVTTHTQENHFYRLRQKLERDPTQAEILMTDPGGYRLIP